MKRCLLLSLAALPMLVTGCPQNEYVIELTPHGDVIERKLTFSRVDGTNHQSFPSNELAEITKAYPAGSVRSDGDKYIAAGKFAGVMPADIGGFGSYTNVATTLGKAGFYMERFRGDDDLAAMTEKRLQAADQLTDIVIGWANAEFGKEPKFEDLRRFLDVNFRHDLKNLGAYVAPFVQFDASWKSILSEDAYKEMSQKGPHDLIARFGEYLLERGYLTTGDLAALIFDNSGNEETLIPQLIQRLVVQKLGYNEGQKLPDSLTVLSHSTNVQESWNNYFETTEYYRAKVLEWEKTKGPDTKDGEKPKPGDVGGELAFAAMGWKFEIFKSSGDSLTVRLSLSEEPVMSNGKWDETLREVTWEHGLPERDKSGYLPAISYAAWGEPDKEYQTQHFGKLVLSGEEIVKYCLWRSSLNPKQAAEWDGLIAGLQPGPGLNVKLQNFRFSGEPPTNNQVVGAILLNGAFNP